MSTKLKEKTAEVAAERGIATHKVVMEDDSMIVTHWVFKPGEQTGWPKGLRKAYINSETKRYKNTVLFHRPHKWYFSIKFKINKRHICYLYFTY